MSVLSVLVAQWHKSFAQEVLSRSAIDACPGPILAICLLLPLLNSAGAVDCELSVENGCAVERVAGLPMVCQWYFIGDSQNDAFSLRFHCFFPLMWSLWWCHGLPRRVRINPTPQLFLCKQWQAWDFPSFLTQNQALSFWEMQPGNEFSQGHHQFIAVFFSMDWSRRFGGVFNITCLVSREWQRCLLLL